MITILITGGAGFIGSHVLENFSHDNNYKFVVVDNLSTGKREYVPDNVDFYELDICDKQIKDIFAKYKFDVVIHLAAQTKVNYSIAHPEIDSYLNIQGTIGMLQLCREYNIGKFIFASTAAVYGDNDLLPLKEDTLTIPTSFYGLSKLTAEHYLTLYSSLFDITTIVLRFANVYGERQGDDGEGGVISIFAKLLVENKTLMIFGDGKQTRDFIYVGDIAKAIMSSTQLNGGFHTFNVATEQETSLNKLIEIFNQNSATPATVCYSPERTGDIKFSKLSKRALLNATGFEAKTDLTIGIKRTLEYFK